MIESAIPRPTALVTGASRGIGRAIALALARQGFDLLISYASNEDAARTTRDECLSAASDGGDAVRVEIARADLARAVDRTHLITTARTVLRRLDLLVNNAGIAPLVRADLLETSEESFDTVISTNLKGPYFLTQSAACWMLETPRPTPGTDGRLHPKIINISSISAYTASVNRGEYCISKAGISMLTALFAERLAESGIGVYEVRPGVIATDMTSSVKAKYDALIAQGMTPIRRWGAPSDVAQAVSAIASGAFPFSTGEVFNVDGGFHLRRL